MEDNMWELNWKIKHVASVPTTALAIGHFWREAA